MKGLGMELSLNKTANVSSNETPTPTRFIRNCEAIGLFQDLNPFEETFKKAVENVKRGGSKSQNVSILGKSAGDELHTPQVFLEENDDHALNAGIHRLPSPEVIVRSEADTSIASDGSVSTVETPRLDPSHEDYVSLLLEMPNGTVLQLSAKAMKNDTPQPCDAIRIAPVQSFPNESVVLATQNANVPVASKPFSSSNPLVKEKLKAFLGGSYRARPSNDSTTSSIPHKVPTKSEVAEKRIPKLIDSLPETGDDKKRKILERNREAAHRCRMKRKRHLESIMQQNKFLTIEVARLRAEVVRLQNLLLNRTQSTLTGVSSCLTMESSKMLITTSARTATAIGQPADHHLIQNQTNQPLVSPLSLHSGQYRKERLKLDIAKASESSLMDLDSPSIVRRDEVLSSVAPPSTPDEGGHFEVMERDVGDTLEKQMTTATTVIQLNPNVVKQNSI